MGIRASTDEDAHDLGEAEPVSQLQGTGTNQLVSRIHIGTSGKQDLNDLGAAFGAMSEVAGETDEPVSDRLVQSGVPILAAPGNPLTEAFHVGTCGKQGLDRAEVAPPGGIGQLAV